MLGGDQMCPFNVKQFLSASFQVVFLMKTMPRSKNAVRAGSKEVKAKEHEVSNNNVAP